MIRSLHRMWPAAGSLALIVGCASPHAVTHPDRETPVWPAPPAAPRIAFESAISGPADLGVKMPIWRRALQMVTGGGHGLEPWVKPQAVAVDERGNLAVADTGAAAICLFQPGTGTYRRWQRVGPHRLQMPVGIAAARERLYVADSALGVVLALDFRGKVLFVLSEGLIRPTGVWAGENRLWVADAGAHQVYCYDLAGQRLATLGQRGSGPGEFNYPTHLAVDAAGRCVITDAMNSRVQVMGPDYRFQFLLGGRGPVSGHFVRPKGVALDSQGRIYVVDASFDNVQIFDHQGRFLLHWGEAGDEPGQFWLPSGIAIDHANRIYVADSYNRRIQVFQYVGEP